jgi:hypothetical protein
VGERVLLGVIAAAAVGVIAMVGCHRTVAPTAASEGANPAATDSGPDPAEANLAPANGNGSTQVLSQSQQGAATQSSQEYPQQQQAAPIERQAPPDQGQGYQGDQGSYDQNADQNAETGYEATLTDQQASEPPPPLPAYDQPEDPDPNDIWTPGYWAYAPAGYYWVPGAWCAPPYIGALWTPGYWGFYGGHYRFHHGFWGPHIGYYGGVNYGFGYVGVGYLGGYWRGSDFNYNRNFNRVGPNIRNVYVRNVTYNNVHYNNYAMNTRMGPRVSYNGGNGGIRATPRPAELAALREPRVAPMQSQAQAEREAAQNRQQFYATNRGRPAIAAAPRPFAAERGIAPPARTTADLARPGMQLQNRPAQPGNRSGQTGMENRPGQPAPQGQPVAPAQPMGVRPGEPATAQPQQPAPPRSEIRRVPQGQFQPRPAQPEPARPTPQGQPQPTRPAPQGQPRPQPEPARPAPQSRPQPQARPQPQPQPQPQPRPQQQARPQPPVRPQPQAQPRPQAPPHDDAHPKL